MGHAVEGGGGGNCVVVTAPFQLDNNSEADSRGGGLPRAYLKKESYLVTAVSFSPPTGSVLDSPSRSYSITDYAPRQTGKGGKGSVRAGEGVDAIQLSLLPP